MKVKRKIQIITDSVMYILFVLLLGYHLLPDAAHEWLGIGLFATFILHTVLNYKWYKVLFKGKYTVKRTVQTVVNFALLAAMLLCIVSAVQVSGVVFRFLNINGAYIGRRIHLAATQWAFVLTSVHLGLHWNGFVTMAKRVKLSDKSRNVLKWVFRATAFCFVVFGVYVFIDRAVWEELFLLVWFKNFNYDKTILQFAFETVSMSSAFVAVTYYISKFFSQKAK